MTIHLPHAVFLYAEWTDDAGHQHGAWAAWSEYGDWSHHWQSMGTDFASFVRRVDCDYLLACLGSKSYTFAKRVWPLFAEAVQERETNQTQGAVA